MSRMTIVIDVDPSVDPTLVDPHEVAEDLVGIANEERERNGATPVAFISAEWGTPG